MPPKGKASHAISVKCSHTYHKLTSPLIISFAKDVTELSWYKFAAVEEGSEEWLKMFSWELVQEANGCLDSWNVQEFWFTKRHPSSSWPSGIAFSLVVAPGIVPILRVPFPLLNQHWKFGGPQQEDVWRVSSTRGDYKKSLLGNKAVFLMRRVMAEFWVMSQFDFKSDWRGWVPSSGVGEADFIAVAKNEQELTSKGTHAHISRTEGTRIQHCLQYHQLSLMRISSFSMGI